MPILTHQFTRKNLQKSKPTKTMKKFIYVLLFAIVSAMTISSCTEEEIAPSTENGGGGVSEPK